MKFGKRFLQAQGDVPGGYLDYKALKQAIKHDCHEQDHLGTRFDEVLQQELRKAVLHYVERERALQDELLSISSVPLVDASERLESLREAAQELTSFAALNYIAVLKAVKKRNRRLRDACGDAVVTVAPFNVLQGQAFFSSKGLSKITTDSNILYSELHPEIDHRADYNCPICLQLLSAPVVLNCSHTFCWGCITMYCLGVLQSAEGDADAASRNSQTDALADKSIVPVHASVEVTPSKMSLLHQGWAPAAGVAAEPAGGRFQCPVCRKLQTLDLDALNVDENLHAFVLQQALRRRSAASDAPITASRSSIAANPLPSPGSPPATSEAVLPSAPCELSQPLPPAAAAVAAEVGSTLPKQMPLDVAPCAALLPPQSPRMRGRLTIVLDLDGTLIASFPPRRAPALPPHVHTHLVGVRSTLNPQGVFVAERPGLSDFLTAVAELGEPVIFTAGLPEYALPIVHAIDPTGAIFGGRIICRQGTSVAPEYPCVKHWWWRKRLPFHCLPACGKPLSKQQLLGLVSEHGKVKAVLALAARENDLQDLTRLGRPLSRTLIVDDTPLAFLWQPGNGVPVLGFRGDPDDTLLSAAVLPLLHTAADAEDVRPFLDARFGMASWFSTHGYCTAPPPVAGNGAAPPADAAAAVEAPDPTPQRALREASAFGVSRASSAATAAIQALVRHSGRLSERVLMLDPEPLLFGGPLLLRVAEALAPELAPMVAAADGGPPDPQAAQAALAEMRRRGVKDPAQCDSAAAASAEVPSGIACALRAAAEAPVALCALSCGIGPYLEAALKASGLRGCFHGVVAHGIAPPCAGDKTAPPHILLPPGGADAAPHGCGICCDSRACRGLHVAAATHVFRTVVFAAAGAVDDVCALLALRETDVALLRVDSPAARALRARRDAALAAAAAPPPAPLLQLPTCAIALWQTPRDFEALLGAFASSRSPLASAEVAALLCDTGIAWESGTGQSITLAAVLTALTASGDGGPVCSRCSSSSGSASTAPSTAPSNCSSTDCAEGAGSATAPSVVAAAAGALSGPSEVCTYASKVAATSVA